MTIPWVEHLLRANTRFNGRLGNQFGAAMTYFSVLAMVPVLMFAFATLGFVLELRPDLLQLVKDEAVKLADAGPDATDKIGAWIDNTLSSYRTIGLVSLATAAYAGSGWVGNLKSAIRAQWRPDFDMSEDKRNIVLETLVNFALLLALLVMVGVTFAIASVGTSLNNEVAALLGLDQIPGMGFVLRLVPVLLSAAAGWVLFMFIYWVFPQTPVALKARMRGSLIAAIGLGILQYGATALFGVFGENAAAAVFGPVIVLMLVLNLFARLILFVAAWIATTEQPALSASDRKPTFDPYAPVQGPQTPRIPMRPRDRYAAVFAATPEKGRTAWVPGEGQEWVTQDVAKQAVKAGMGAGWASGIGLGLGVGATVAGAVSAMSRRLRRK
ncbi:YhjD/YihY/BrkB family envelope integrity protein [Propionibacteriaceae bacterium Y2014]